jgi:Glycosyl transferase family 2
VLNKRPSITVLLTVYNGKQYIGEAVESILSQTYADFEFLVIDDGSDDNSADIVASFSDPRIVLVRLDHGGLVTALNSGLSRAKGEFIARMDADDRARPNRLAVQHAFLKANTDIDIVCSDIATITVNGRFSGKQTQSLLNNDLLRQGLLYQRTIKPVVHPTIMMRQEVAAKLGGYRQFETSQDHDFWLRAVDRFQIRRINEVLLDYRIYDGGMSRTKVVGQATNSGMSALNYLVRRTTGVDLFDDEPALFKSLADQMRRTIESEINVPAAAFRSARLKMLSGRSIAGSFAMLCALTRFGTKALPFRTTKQMRREIDRLAATACAELTTDSRPDGYLTAK